MLLCQEGIDRVDGECDLPATEPMINPSHNTNTPTQTMVRGITNVVIACNPPSPPSRQPANPEISEPVPVCMSHDITRNDLSKSITNGRHGAMAKERGFEAKRLINMSAKLAYELTCKKKHGEPSEPIEPRCNSILATPSSTPLPSPLPFCTPGTAN